MLTTVYSRAIQAAASSRLFAVTAAYCGECEGVYVSMTPFVRSSVTAAIFGVSVILFRSCATASKLTALNLSPQN